MQERARRWFPVHIYTDPIAQYRAMGTYASAAVIAVGTIIGILVVASMLIGGASLHDPVLATILVCDVILIVVTPIIIVLTRSKRQTLAALVILAAWFAITLYAYIALKDFELGITLSVTGIALGALLIGEITV